MTRIIALPLAAGLLSALLFVSLAKGIAMGVLLSYLAPLPPLMAGLMLGQAAGAAAGITGAVAVGLGIGGHATIPFLVAVALPVLVVSNRALLWRSSPDGAVEWYPPGLVLAWLAAAGAALLVTGALLLPDGGQGVEAWVANAIGRTLELMAPDVPEAQRRSAVEFWTPFFPAMICASWLVMAVANAAGAQGLLVRLGKSRRPSPSYRELWLPDWLGVVLLVAGLAGAVAEGGVGYVARNVAVVALVPFALLGLAGVHSWAAGRPRARLLLAVVYGLLFLAFGPALVAVAGLGVVRFWTMRFRSRAQGGGGGQEE